MGSLDDTDLARLVAGDVELDSVEGQAILARSGVDRAEAEELVRTARRLDAMTAAAAGDAVQAGDEHLMVRALRDAAVGGPQRLAVGRRVPWLPAIALLAAAVVVTLFLWRPSAPDDPGRGQTLNSGGTWELEKPNAFGEFTIHWSAALRPGEQFRVEVERWSEDTWQKVESEPATGESWMPERPLVDGTYRWRARLVRGEGAAEAEVLSTSDWVEFSLP